MYKLLLVDDEEEVRQNMISRIKWEDYGFELIGEAQNGLEALEIVEKIIPDVVITDIKMPFMDGLELSKALRKKYPTIKIVIVTGFDEFEYAQKALNLNVIEYLLKPVSLENIAELLLKMKTLIDEEISQREDMKSLREYYVSSLPILKEKFLTTLVTSNLTKEEIMEKCKNYNISLEGKYFAAAVIGIDKDFKKLGDTDNSAEASELNKFAVLNVANEIGSQNGKNNIFMHMDQVVLIIAYNEEESYSNRILYTLENIRQSIEKFFKFTITIGLGNVVDRVSDIFKSYQNAVSALDYRLVIGNNRVIWIEDIEPAAKVNINFDEGVEHEISNAIKFGTEEEIEKTINNIFAKLFDVHASFKDYQIYLLEMLIAILKVAKSPDTNLEEIFGEKRNLFEELNSFYNLNQVRDWFIHISVQIMKTIRKNRQETSTLLVEKAKDYIKTHYSDNDITINEVCNFLHISPTYFSFIFKRETEMTFTGYLTQVRMEAAKELLRTTNMKLFAIAEKVGYSEPNYFSYSFKRYFGVSPKEYRSSVQASD
jgi:two-component system response regulator YesN